MQLSYRTVRTLVTLGLVVIVMGWIGIMKLTHRAEQSTQTTADIAEFCRSDQTLKNAPAYQASGNNPLALYARSNTAASVVYKGVHILGLAPLNSPLHDTYSTVNRRLVSTDQNKQTPAVVACLRRSNDVKTDQVCEYTDQKVPVYKSGYELTVYEANNRHVLFGSDIPAQETYTCQSFSAYDGKGFYHGWDTNALAMALLRFAQ